ncbi:MAG TPA: hypothetical protein VHJ20_16580 [Polyangia bacterium]|nr:hypothetical protein [Polyangia bacterium]
MRSPPLGAIHLLAATMALGASACLPAPEQAEPLSETFAVSDYFTPSGYMGDGQRLGNITVEVNSANCKPRPVGARGDCYVFTYHKDAYPTNHWAGVYWVFPANNWGSSYGRAVTSENFKQIRFQAALEAPMPYTAMGGSPQPFSAFSGDIDPQGNFNNLNMVGVADHKDAVNANTSLMVGTDLTTDLRPFSLPLSDFAKGQNCVVEPAPPAPQIPNNCDAAGFASDLIGAFGWAIHYPDDSDPDGSKGVKLYLDDIVWDTTAP